MWNMLLQTGKSCALMYMLDKCPPVMRDNLQMKIVEYVRDGHAPLVVKAKLVKAFNPTFVKCYLHDLNTQEHAIYYDGINDEYDVYSDGPVSLCFNDYSRTDVLDLLKNSPFERDVQAYIDFVCSSM
jgi:hypothetical protein